jgi:hypothetical protein
MLELVLLALKCKEHFANSSSLNDIATLKRSNIEESVMLLSKFRYNGSFASSNNVLSMNTLRFEIYALN